MGAAGLTSSARRDGGARRRRASCSTSIAVPLREAGMTPYEILLSESQERMLLVARAGQRGRGPRRSSRSGTSRPWSIGRVTDDGVCRARWHGEDVVRIPVDRRSPTRRRSTSGRPRSRRGSTRLQALDLRDRSASPTDYDADAADAARRARTSARASGSTASTTSSSAATRSCGPGADAAVVRIEGTRRGARAHRRLQQPLLRARSRTSAR